MLQRSCWALCCDWPHSEDLSSTSWTNCWRLHWLIPRQVNLAEDVHVDLKQRWRGPPRVGSLLSSPKLRTEIWRTVRSGSRREASESGKCLSASVFRWRHRSHRFVARDRWPRRRSPFSLTGSIHWWQISSEIAKLYFYESETSLSFFSAAQKFDSNCRWTLN